MRIPRQASVRRKPAAKGRGSRRLAEPGAWDALEAIAADVSGGASEVARALLAWGESWSAGAPGTGREAIVGLERLARRQAALAPVLRIANDMLVEFDRLGPDDEAALRGAAGKLCGRWRERLDESQQTLRLHLRRALGSAPAIYTYSASSTVQGAIEDHFAGGAWFRVVVSESRPGCEGTRLAAALAGRGIPVALGTDAWLWGAIEDEGLLVVGADTLLPTGWVNKRGSRVLALRARERGVAVVCAADTGKFLPPALAALPRSYERDPVEILADPPSSMTIANPYFEEIEWEALDVLVTERGPTRPRDLRSGDIPVARALRDAKAH
jgi:translation initiation factor 2B subunit (eIF-2B alpha/beta/delta family)